jgi:hypothetical protein
MSLHSPQNDSPQQPRVQASTQYTWNPIEKHDIIETYLDRPARSVGRPRECNIVYRTLLEASKATYYPAGNEDYHSQLSDTEDECCQRLPLTSAPGDNGLFAHISTRHLLCNGRVRPNETGIYIHIHVIGTCTRYYMLHRLNMPKSKGIRQNCL